MHCVNILLIMIKMTYSQSDDSYDQSQTQEDDYDEPKTHYHRLRHHRKPKYPASDVVPYVSGYDYPYNEDDCECSCSKCDVVKPCCKDFCMHCQGMNQPNMYYMPYPIPQYPVAPFSIIMPNSTKFDDVSTTTQTTTTQTTTTTTTISPPPSVKTLPIVIIPPTTQAPIQEQRREAVIEVSDIYINDNLNRNDAKYILTSLRRTKPYWQANGVVPIPNNLAEKLMTQMKDDTKQNRRVFRSYQP